MRKVDLVASMSHYADHLEPIWDKLPIELRGDVRIGPNVAAATPPRDRVCMVAGWQDMEPLRGLTSFIYVEHGAGQNYGGDEKSAHWPGYSASRGERHPDMVGYICPSQRVADLFSQRAPAVAVGSPRLDQFINNWTPPVANTYCFNFHWPCEVSPEAGTAWPHYRQMLPHIVERFRRAGWRGYFHVHPRWEGRLDDELHRAGLSRTRNPLSCKILFCDNSSTMFETAALGRYIVALNTPTWRRDVHHGLRFWGLNPGLMLDEPEQLMEFPINYWTHPEINLLMSQHAADLAYARTDGYSSVAAADAITSWVA